MLARYQPTEWAAHINIDASRYAIAVEILLKRAVIHRGSSHCLPPGIRDIRVICCPGCEWGLPGE